MILLKALLLLVSIGALASAGATVIYDIVLAFELDRILRRRRRAVPFRSVEKAKTPQAVPGGRAIRCNAAAPLIAIAAISGLAAPGVLVVEGRPAVLRISQTWDVRPGTPSAGTQPVFPWLDRVNFPAGLPSPGVTRART